MTTASRPDEIEPKFEWLQKDGCDTLLVHLSGYKRENLKVQVTTSRNLRVFGERKINDKKSIRFHKEFSLPNECDMKGITAKFEKEVLQIKLPTKTSSPSASALASAGVQKAPAAEETGMEDHEKEEKSKGSEAQGGVSKGKYKEKKMTSIGKMMRKRGTLIAVVIVAVGVAIALGVGLLH